MLDSMNLPDKTQVAVAERFVLVSSSAVVYKFTKASKRGKNFPQDCFIISLRKL